MNNYFTLAETYQQKKLWKETLNIIKSKKEIIENFLNKFDYQNRKIIFTGAGTSEFVGNTIKPSLKNNFMSIATTDIVANPENYLNKNEKIILVSFARSGNSPESVATVKLADQIVDDICHIFITCNSKGALAIDKKNDKKALVLLMPEESNDKGFAMTSSFTCMALAALATFNINDIENIEKYINESIEKISSSEENLNLFIKTLVSLDTSRIIYLGSSCLKGLAEECSLKCLELTAGNMALNFNSPLGFRHGPKSIVNDTTMIIVLLSNNSYTREYEIDLLKEMYSENKKKYLVTIDMGYSEEVKSNTNFYFSFGKEIPSFNEVYNMFSYVYFAQLFAFNKSLNFNINPDNPCPTGEVNRVVKGVIIHKYNK